MPWSRTPPPTAARTFRGELGIKDKSLKGAPICKGVPLPVEHA